jgi:acyl dehydratase
MKKLYLEDIEPGLRLESPWYAIEREEVVEFARRWDPYDFHLDEEAAERSTFGGLVACTSHLFAISSRLAHRLPGEVALIAGLGGDGLQVLAPVRVDTRVRLVRRFTSARLSRSRPEAGVVAFEDVIESPEGETLFRTSGSVLIQRRDAGPSNEADRPAPHD